MSDVKIINAKIINVLNGIAVECNRGYVLINADILRKYTFEVLTENGRYQTNSMSDAIDVARKMGIISKDKNGNPLSLDQLEHLASKREVRTTIRNTCIIMAVCFALVLIPFIPMMLKAM
jgi:hypothetical protein